MWSPHSENWGDTTKSGNKNKGWSVQDNRKCPGKAANLDRQDEGKHSRQAKKMIQLKKTTCANIGDKEIIRFPN